MASLTEIAENILAQAKRLDAFTTSKGLPSSSFDLHTLFDLPDDLEECRKDLVDACQSLKQLGNGPVGQFYEVLFNVSLPKFRSVLNGAGGRCFPHNPYLLRSTAMVAEIHT